MKVADQVLNDVQLTDSELELILAVRSKFKCSDCCLDIVIDFVNGLEAVK